MKVGVGLDLRNLTACPGVDRLNGFALAQLTYKVPGLNHQKDPVAAFAAYDPYLTALQTAGHAVCVVLNHETWGEGYCADWDAMTDADWRRFIPLWVDHVIEYVIRPFAGRGFEYKCWNEQDSKDGRASVRIRNPKIWGKMFRLLQARMLKIDPTAKLSTGGLNSGPVDAYNYLIASGAKPYRIHINEWGRGAASNPNFCNWGTIEDALCFWKAHIDIPVVIGEFGVQGKPDELAALEEAVVAKYLADFVQAAARHGAEAVIMFAYGVQDNAYGITAPDGKIRQKLIDALIQPMTRMYLTGCHPDGNLLRAEPSLDAPVLRALRNGDEVLPRKMVKIADGKRWRKLTVEGQTGWAVPEGEGWQLQIVL